MIGLHEAMSYCENFTVGVLTLLGSIISLYVGQPVIAVLLCGSLLVAQAVYKLMKEEHGTEMLLVCGILFAIAFGGAVFSSGMIFSVLMAASVYDCFCHRRLRLSQDGIFSRGAAIEAEASRDIGMGGCVPSARFMSSGH